MAVSDLKAYHVDLVESRPRPSRKSRLSRRCCFLALLPRSHEINGCLEQSQSLTNTGMTAPPHIYYGVAVMMDLWMHFPGYLRELGLMTKCSDRMLAYKR